MTIDDVCPCCKRKINLATEITEKGINENIKPREGSVCVCLECGCISMFDASLRLRELKPEEMKMLRDEDPVQFDFMIRASFAAAILPKKERMN